MTQFARVFAPATAPRHNCGMRRSLLSLAFALAFSLAPAAEATVLANWSMEEVVSRADSVVIGTIGAKRTVEGKKGRLLTETTVQVDEVLMGAPRGELVVSQLGGRRGEVVTEVAGDAKLEPGARMLLMTFEHKDGRRYIVGMALGAFRLDGEATLVQRIDATLLDDQGKMHPAPGLRKTSLEKVRALVAPKGNAKPR